MTLTAYDCCTDAVRGTRFRFGHVCASGIKKDGKSKAQALKALKSVKRSTWRQSRKPRYSTVFHRPKTFEAPRKPKYPRLRYKRGQEDATLQAVTVAVKCACSIQAWWAA